VPVRAVFTSVADSQRTLRSTRPPTVSPADPRPELGPRSLDPGRSFWSAFAELIRGQSLPTDFCNIHRRAGNQTRARDPRRDGGRDLLPFLYVSRPLPCDNGDTRRAAQRPNGPTPVLVPPTCAGLPNRDAETFAPPPQLAPRCIVRIDAHGSEDRAKDASPKRMRRSLVPASGACALWRMRDGVPLLGDLRTSAVVGAAPLRGDTRRSDGPT
jgi:hypothetical protein